MSLCAASTCIAQRLSVRPVSLGLPLRPRPQAFRPAYLRSQTRRLCITQAKQNEDKIQLPALLGAANGITNSIAGLVPASVPRPIAKAGVLSIGSIVAFWIFGKVVSTLFTVALVAGAGYVFVKSRSSSGSASQLDTNDGDDPLASARRIMDKYK